MDEAGAKILIVEDDATIARFVELELTHLGHEVYKVADGDLAVAEIERVCPDLVLLDLMLPGTDGLTIARDAARARAEDADPHAHGPLGDPGRRQGLRRRRRRLPAQAVRDPRAALARRARCSSASSTTVRSTSYKAANVELDPASRGVLVDGEPVNFTAKEYDLLEYFVANAGRVISRDEILEKVWGGQHATDSNVIEVFVCHLRNKINDNDNQVIRTIRGVGYFFARS